MAEQIKEHKGIIHGKLVHGPHGPFLMGFYKHPDGKITLRYTSMVLHHDGDEYETMNSKYTLREMGNELVLLD